MAAVLVPPPRAGAFTPQGSLTHGLVAPRLSLGADRVAELRALWLAAVGEVGTAAAGGHRLLQQVLARFAARASGTQPWETALDDCVNAFVEACAEILEACEAPALAPIVGHAARMAEAFSRTEPLLKAFEEELRKLQETYGALQGHYERLLERLEGLEAPQLESPVRRAEREEAERARLAAERRAERAAAELREARAGLRDLALRPATATRAVQTTPRRASVESAAEVVAAPSLGARWAEAAELPGSSALHGRGPSPGRMDRAASRADVIPRLRRSTFKLGDEFAGCTIDLDAVSPGLSPIAPHSRSATPPTVTPTVLRRGCRSLLDLGATWSASLPPRPLTGSIQAAFAHLSTLVAGGRGVPLPEPGELAQTADPLQGLGRLAALLGDWAQRLAKADRALSVSVKHAAAHLGALVTLPRGSAASPAELVR